MIMTRTRKRRAAAGGALAAALAGLAGCGGSPGAGGAGDAAVRFAAAVAQGDGDTACALLTDQARESVTGATGLDCADVVATLSESEARATDVQVWGDAAQAAVGGDTLFLLRYDGGWRVDAAGCTEASSGPYDCEVHS